MNVTTSLELGSDGTRTRSFSSSKSRVLSAKNTLHDDSHTKRKPEKNPKKTGLFKLSAAVDDERKAGWQWQGLCPLQSQVAPTTASVMVFGELAHNVGIPVMALAPKRDTGEEVDCFLLPFSRSNQKTDISKPKRDTEPNRPFIWDLAASQTMRNPCV